MAGCVTVQQVCLLFTGNADLGTSASYLNRLEVPKSVRADPVRDGHIDLFTGQVLCFERFISARRVRISLAFIPFVATQQCLC